MFSARQRSPLVPAASPQTPGNEAPARPTPTARRPWIQSCGLLVASLLLVGMSCSRQSIPASLPITHQPATNLRLSLGFAGQYGNDQRFANDPTHVQVSVNVYEGANPQPVVLPKGDHLTCGGADITPTDIGHLQHACLRQQPGGTYRFVFTDEHGGTTTLLVPIPSGKLAVLSPAPDSNMRIPTSGDIDLRIATPVPPAGGSVVINSVMALCGHGGCGTSMAPYQLSPAVTAAPTQPGGPIPMTCPPSTQSPFVTLGKGGGAISILPLPNDSFQPGPGTIQLGVDTCVPLTPTGFNAAIATFSDALTSPITWTD